MLAYLVSIEQTIQSIMLLFNFKTSLPLIQMFGRLRMVGLMGFNCYVNPDTWKIITGSENSFVDDTLVLTQHDH